MFKSLNFFINSLKFFLSLPNDYDIYLDPKNDYLINHSNPTLGYNDCEKIDWVMEQNDVRIIILDKTQLTWDKIEELIKGR